MADSAAVSTFPVPLDAYGPPSPDGLLATLASRIESHPFNAVATGIFLLAIVHTFAAPKVAAIGHRIQHDRDAEARAAGRPSTPSIVAELLHLFGEVEVVFALWAVVLRGAIWSGEGWATAAHYLNDTVVYTEALFVVVIMALASTRPVITFAERMLSRVAALGGRTPAAWWVTILIVAPLLGSFITEPGAMTIGALLLARQFYDLEPPARLRYATLGLLFVNVSIGGTLTHFAAPPVLMVARPWGWDLPFMLVNFGSHAVLAVLVSTALYGVIFRRDLRALAALPSRDDIEQPEPGDDPSSPRLLPVPAWITAVHLGFMAWTVVTAHYPALFLGGFLFFLGFVRATSPYQSLVELRSPLLVGLFLGGLVIHGGLQGWWIAPVLSALPEGALFLGAALLTAFNDNALITYLATLVPDLGDALRLAVVQGAVTGGGLTVIANAPNPAGLAILGRFFPSGISPLGLLLAAIPPTLVAALAFRSF